MQTATTSSTGSVDPHRAWAAEEERLRASVKAAAGEAAEPTNAELHRLRDRIAATPAQTPEGAAEQVKLALACGERGSALGEVELTGLRSALATLERMAATAAAHARLAEAWNMAATWYHEALLKGQHDELEEAEGKLLRVAAAFLLEQGKGGLPVPAGVATWLHLVLEDALSGFAIPGVRQRTHGRTAGEVGTFLRQTAVAYIEAAREGLIEDPDPVDSVAGCYGVHPRNVYKWQARLAPYAGLGMRLKEELRNPAERTAWAKRMLVDFGVHHKAKNARKA